MSRILIVLALVALVQINCVKRIVNLDDLMIRNVREVEASGEASGETTQIEASGEKSEVEASGEAVAAEASGDGSGDEVQEGSGEGSGTVEGSGLENTVEVVEPLVLTDPIPENIAFEVGPL